MTVAEGGNWFVNWADIPSVVPINGDLWAAHWLVKKTGGTYSYDLYGSISEDAGETWSDPFVVHDDGTATEHGFASLFAWGDGVGMVWLDGRNTSGSHGSHSGGMTLRAARFSADSTATERVEIDDLVCDCCSTDVTLAAKGLVAVYRDRTEGEIRDISVTRMIDGAWSVGAPVANDNWEIDGCPVNGPAIDSFEDHVAVAWFTAADDKPAVRLAFSGNNAASFSPPLDIDTAMPLGRVDVVQLDAESAVVSWLSPAENGAATIVARLATTNDQLGDRITVAPSSAERSSGFPQMIRLGDSLLFAWTEVQANETRFRTKLIPIDTLH